MFTWLRIAPSGEIIDTRRAPDRETAEQILAGTGSVVSAASWRLDVHKWRPVQTVVTDQIQRQKPRRPVVRLPHGMIGTGDALERLGISERRLRHITTRYKIRPKRLTYGARVVLGYTPLQLEAIRQIASDAP